VTELSATLALDTINAESEKQHGYKRDRFTLTVFLPTPATRGCNRLAKRRSYSRPSSSRATRFLPAPTAEPSWPSSLSDKTPASRATLSSDRVRRDLVHSFDPGRRGPSLVDWVPWVRKQFDDRLPDAWRDVHDDMSPVKLIWMRQAARVRDHLKIPLEGERVVADSHRDPASVGSHDHA